MVSDEALRNLENLVEWTLQKWRDHREWEDLRQEAIIRAWRAVEKMGSVEDLAFSTIVVHAARWAVRDFFFPRSTSEKGKTIHYGSIKTISLEDLEDEDEGSSEADFVPVLLDRMEAELICKAAELQVTPRDWDLVWRHIALGRNAAAIGLEESCGRQTVLYRVHRALERIRKSLDDDCR